LLAVASRDGPDAESGRLDNVGQSVSSEPHPPRVVVDHATHDFGTMDPLTTGSYSFVIRNEGSGPLKLTAGSTTCKCTVSELTRSVIEPGGSGSVRLTWNTGRGRPVYAHSATILTNDPKQKSIQLQIRGVVRVQLGAAPPEIVLDGVEPDQPQTVSTWIYSQIWDGLQVEQVTCSSDELRWEVEPVDPSERPALKAKSACRLSLTLPAGLPEGFFREVVTCQVRPSASGKVETLEISLSGKVLRRLALYGPGIDASGTLDLGVLPTGQGKDCRLVLKVRDAVPELTVRDIETTPDFLDVELDPYETSSAATGLYHLNISVPQSAPACTFLHGEAGRIKLAIDHPRIGDLELRVRFAVIARK
jgi:hypothetical protein